MGVIRAMVGYVMSVLPVIAAMALGALLMAYLLGCAGFTPKDLANEYEMVNGALAAEPLLDDTKKRLFIYLKVIKPETDETYIIEAVIFNPERKDLLRRIQGKLIESNAPVFLYCVPIKGQWQEYIKGADYEVVAVGLYNVRSQRREIIHASYGNSMTDAIRSVRWGDFIKAALKKGAKTAIP